MGPSKESEFTHTHRHTKEKRHTQVECVGVLYNSGFVFWVFELIRYHIEFQM